MGSRALSPVDEEPRCPRHAKADPCVDVLLNPCRVGATRQAPLEPWHIEPDLPSIQRQPLRTELRRISEKQVVVLPELVLVLCAAGRLGRLPGGRMDAVEREVTKDKP